MGETDKMKDLARQGKYEQWKYGLHTTQIITYNLHRTANGVYQARHCAYVTKYDQVRGAWHAQNSWGEVEKDQWIGFDDAYTIYSVHVYFVKLLEGCVRPSRVMYYDPSEQHEQETKVDDVPLQMSAGCGISLRELRADMP